MVEKKSLLERQLYYLSATRPYVQKLGVARQTGGEDVNFFSENSSLGIKPQVRTGNLQEGRKQKWRQRNRADDIPKSVPTGRLQHFYQYRPSI
jgi:hypothetical protein